MVYDLFVSKNQFTEKSGGAYAGFKDILGDAFVFSKGDKLWKAKR